MSGRLLGELAGLVGGVLEGDAGRVIRGLASLDTAGPDDLSFVTSSRYLPAALRSEAAAFLAAPGLVLEGRSVIRVSQPYLAVARLLPEFYPEPRVPAGVHPTAQVDGSAQVARTASLGAFVVVAEDAVVEDDAVLHPHVFVGPGSRVGEGSVLHAHVVLRARVDLGRRVVIQAGSVLGADGFGYVFDGRAHRKVPQVGRVVVQDDVEIGANVTVDRATLGDTVIGRGTKIDNLVQIAHNVTVGPDTIIVAQTGVAGSSHIGRGVILGGQVGVGDHVTVGDGARVGSQSGLHRDVPAGVDVIGSPALPAEEGLRALAAVGRLPDLVRTVRALGRRVAALERRLGEGGVGTDG